MNTQWLQVLRAGHYRGVLFIAMGLVITPPLLWAADTTPPSGSVVINGNAARTNSTTVTLTLSATDSAGPVTQMRFSNIGGSSGSFSTPEPYATTKTWVINSADGTQNVYAQFKDAAGNWSGSVSDWITLDTKPPTFSGLSASSITTSGATLKWTTNEPATSQVEYGPTTSYGQSSPLDTTLVTNHTVSLTGLAAGTLYHYRTHSKDAAGNEGIGTDATFTTTGSSDTTPPTVTLTSPANGATVKSTIMVSTNASDNVGVVGVQFKLDGVNLGTEDTTSPYGVSWDTTTSSNASHTVTAIARDAAGNTTTSSAVTVTVNNPVADTTPPIGSMTINGGASVTNNTAVTLALSATDNSGIVSQMQFSNDGTSFSSPEPYATTKTWTITNGDGTKTVSVKFADAAGNWSTPSSAAIVLDTTPPQLNFTSPLDGAVITAPSP